MVRAKKQKVDKSPEKPRLGVKKDAPQKGKCKAKESSFPRSFKIIAGTYEKLLYGLDVRVSTPDDGDKKLQFSIKPVFAFPAHVSCVKAVAASPQGGKWLATGSADEIIKVWDLRRRKEVGGLMHHQGSITHLSFPSRSHLLSASEDGTLCLFHARDWSVLRSMKGHKARINSVAVHPSGKLALSVGKDRTLRMWDLMRGKGVASTKLGKEGEVVRWSTDGSKFVVQSGSTMDIYDTAMTLLHNITHPSRLHDVKFASRPPSSSGGEGGGKGGDLLLAGAEDKKLTVYQVYPDPQTPPRVIAELIGHERRVKAVQTIAIQPSNLGSQQQPRRPVVIIACTASSDGKIRLFDLASIPEVVRENDEGLVQIDPVAEYDTKGTRLTCIAVADGDNEGEGGEGQGLKAVVGKRKREDEGEDDVGSESEEGEEEEWGGLGEDEDGNESG
ncbi:WD40-repeat-containing domain protein [Amanita rubescens]|nr:WD40-repeat-containing domain protein [Amanita rubescens]